MQFGSTKNYIYSSWVSLSLFSRTTVVYKRYKGLTTSWIGLKKALLLIYPESCCKNMILKVAAATSITLWHWNKLPYAIMESVYLGVWDIIQRKYYILKIVRPFFRRIRCTKLWAASCTYKDFENKSHPSRDAPPSKACFAKKKFQKEIFFLQVR